VARDPSAPPQVLTRLAEDQHRGMRVGVARDPSTPPDALTRLAEDTSWSGGVERQGILTLHPMLSQTWSEIPNIS